MLMQYLIYFGECLFARTGLNVQIYLYKREMCSGGDGGVDVQVTQGL